MQVNDVTSFILYPPNTWIFILVKFIFVGATVFFILIILYGIFRTSWLDHYFLRDFRELTTFKPFAVHKIAKPWQKISARLDTGMESEYKLAVIETDTILDDILKRMGYAGDSLGERLKSVTPEIIPNVTDLIEAHKIRNNIVHDPDYKLSLEEAKKAIRIYETTLSELQAI